MRLGFKRYFNAILNIIKLSCLVRVILLDSYKREAIAGQLSIVAYVLVLKNYAAAARDLVLLDNSRLLLINAYNYWTW